MRQKKKKNNVLYHKLTKKERFKICYFSFLFFPGSYGCKVRLVASRVGIRIMVRYELTGHISGEIVLGKKKSDALLSNANRHS